MTEQLTYRTINQRCKETAKEIVSKIACFDTAEEANTWDSWQSCLDALESFEDDVYDHAHTAVDSWDWCIYTHYGMQVCQAVLYEDLCDAESEYADIWDEAPEGLYEYASRLGYLILCRMLTDAIVSEVEACRELAESLQESAATEGPEDGDYILSDCGSLGAGTMVSQYGKTLYSGSQQGAESFIRETMEFQKYWPSVWYQDDHGGISQVFINTDNGES